MSVIEYVIAYRSRHPHGKFNMWSEHIDKENALIFLEECRKLHPKFEFIMFKREND